MDGLMSWIERLLDGSLLSGGVFLLIGVVGGVLLLLSVVLDGVFDIFDFGDGPLSLTTIAAFVSIFGFTAFACVGAGVPTPLAGTLGAVAGLLGGVAAWWLSRVIRGAESTTAATGSDLVGRQGAVVLPIQAEGLGEIALIMHGERISLAATAAVPVPRGAQVRIVQTITATSVLVEPLLAPTGENPAPADDPHDPTHPSD